MDKLTEFQKKSLEYQRNRYDLEANDYAVHQGDLQGHRYRNEFIRSRLFDFDLTDKQILDAMCASGIETKYLISRGASVTGLDISPNNKSMYCLKWQRDCIVASIHDTGLPSESFDCIYIFGGLHHVIPCLQESVVEVHRLLKPGGRFAFVEPNKDSWSNYFRMAWYKADARFHETEEALSYPKQLLPLLSIGFEEEKYFTGGNIAYLFICQSLVIGTPIKAKSFLYPPLAFLERMLNPLPFAPHLYFAALWRKV